MNKELYSYFSSCINRDLGITGDANAKLCMSHLMVEGSGGTLGAHPWDMYSPPADKFCGYVVIPQYCFLIL